MKMKKALLGVFLLALIFTSGCVKGGKGASPSNLDTSPGAPAANMHID